MIILHASHMLKLNSNIDLECLTSQNLITSQAFTLYYISTYIYKHILQLLYNLKKKTFSSNLNNILTNFEMEENLSSSLPVVQPPPNYGNLITVLSIDGGGIRGIIPATILSFLESQLQVIQCVLYIFLNVTSYHIKIICLRMMFIYKRHVYYRSGMGKRRDSQITLT